MDSADHFLKLLETSELPGLGPGPRDGVLSEAELRAALPSGEEAEHNLQLMLALLLLWHDHLDSAHAIAQSVESADGAFVHGLMHRREPDYGNAAYWFRRVGAHPVFKTIGTRVRDCLRAKEAGELLERLMPQGHWDPFAFIDACKQANSRSDPNGQILRAIQRIETVALLNHLAQSEDP